MLVLLTGASGFVGSHVLESLLGHGLATAVLLRSTSKRDFIKPYLHKVQVRTGSILDESSLERALDGVTHVIHCAGLTRARYPQEFFETNHTGTKNVVDAVNKHGAAVKRLVYVSSLAAVGPCGPDAPATEETPPHPVSVYGMSKLKGEQEVREHCETEHVILRPPAVYGPRDDGFLPLFKMVRSRIMVEFVGGVKVMSFIYVRDLAEAILKATLHPDAAGKTYFVTGRETISPADFVLTIAKIMGVKPARIPLPVQLMWPICVGMELLARLRNRPVILNRQKYAELRAQGWVCDGSRIERELGIVCPTSIPAGIKETVQWYTEHAWL